MGSAPLQSGAEAQMVDAKNPPAKRLRALLSNEQRSSLFATGASGSVAQNSNPWGAKEVANGGIVVAKNRKSATLGSGAEAKVVPFFRGVRPPRIWLPTSPLVSHRSKKKSKQRPPKSPNGRSFKSKKKLMPSKHLALRNGPAQTPFHSLRHECCVFPAESVIQRSRSNSRSQLCKDANNFHRASRSVVPIMHSTGIRWSTSHTESSQQSYSKAF
jgi:hypothetical protein